MKRLKRSYEMDMCHGPLFSKIIMFAIPLILSGVLQLLFNAADIVVDTEVADAQSEDVETDSTEDLFCLLDVPILEMPDLAGTTWSFCGGNIGGVQMTQDDYDAALEQYGGKLEIVFSDDGSTVQMVQGGGTLDGVCEYHYEDEGVRLTFDNNGTDLVYACVFADFDGLTMVALSDTSGYNAVYFVQ